MIPKQIAIAFLNAQKEFAPIVKSSTNPYFKNKYANLFSCIESVISALNKNGIALIQTTKQCENNAHGVIVKTVFMHESGETLDGGELFVPSAKPDAQGYGSALTYARRYSLLAACGIAPEEDDDGNEACKKPLPIQPKQQVTNEPTTDNNKIKQDYLDKLGAAENLEKLQETFAAAWKYAQQLRDLEFQKDIKLVYDFNKNIHEGK
jgi:hypothetical protein